MGKKFRFYNLLAGWIIFLIAAVVYLLTLEPTTSFWDCGEFIAAAYKLQVGHPPGAPFFMLLGRFFSLFAGGDTGKVAYMVNAMSALASAFTILFLFWTITHMARRMLSGRGELSDGQLIAVLGSGLVGALAYTFSDTFWFSAVEGEVYALSSLFTAVVFWAVLMWEHEADEPGSNRWLILIALLMGLSIGVHLLNLLAIPAIVFVYYFRKYTVSRNGILMATLVSVLLLGTMVYVIIPGFVRVSSWFELLFVNSLGMPYMSGMVIYLITVIVLLALGLHYTAKYGKVVLNTILLGLTMVLLGYFSYALIPIRSLANPPMDENSPDNPFALIYYLNREQYGERPLVKGHYYSAPVVDVKDGSPRYYQEDGRYKVAYYAPKYIYDERFNSLFPRMWSSRPEHIRAYEEWGNVKGRKIQVRTRTGEPETLIKPTFGENLRFLFSYQLGHMYFRYFMWNFAGRQNDVQGHGDILKGNWISGIGFIDEARLGPQENLPGRYANNAATNRYYMLPLLLGIIGLVVQSRCHKKDFWVVMLLFVLTGIAIVVYLNQHPYQPRERDYAYAASFYAFSIWIGLGVAGIFRTLPERLSPVFTAGTVTLAALLLVPGIMAVENWDDHDRSGRYTARDIAFNYLNSCERNGIIFTNGDNDTFPLWYAQDVEGMRTDVRVVNMMLFMTDWYIDQMKRKAYESEPLPITLPVEKYRDGTNNQIMVRELFRQPLDMKQVLEWIMDPDPRTQLTAQDGRKLDFIPTKRVRIPVDPEKVIANGTVPAELADRIEPYVEIELNRSYINKNQLMLLDLLATNGWERPVYFVSGGHEDAMGMEDYFQLEGFAYRLVPVKTTTDRSIMDFGRVHTERLRENLMEKFQWGRMNEPGVYLDLTNLHTFSVIRIRNNFVRLANALVNENRPAEAEAALDRVMELMPPEKVSIDFYVLEIIKAYYRCGAAEKGLYWLEQMAARQENDISYFLGLKNNLLYTVDYEVRVALQMLQECQQIAGTNSEDELSAGLNEKLNRYYLQYTQRMGMK